MSRMGKKPIEVPAAVKLEQNGQVVTVTGPKGTLTLTLPEGILLEKEDARLTVKKSDEKSKRLDVLHGTMRSLLNSMIIGVSAGFKINLELVGVGYRASVSGQNMKFDLGYSIPVEYTVPEGVKVSMADQTHITLESIDKQLVGQVAATIRRFRVPDSYHGKGVRYAGEQLSLKEGKRA